MTWYTSGEAFYLQKNSCLIINFWRNSPLKGRRKYIQIKQTTMSAPSTAKVAINPPNCNKEQWNWLQITVRRGILYYHNCCRNCPVLGKGQTTQRSQFSKCRNYRCWWYYFICWWTFQCILATFGQFVWKMPAFK